jgi:3-oxoacyl-[acyl-carrier protein] reductase
VRQVDIVVNNAGSPAMVCAERRGLGHGLNTNLKGAFLVTKGFSRRCSVSVGRIITFPPLAASWGTQASAITRRAKPATGFTLSAAREFASRGITVNAIAPGFMRRI